MRNPSRALDRKSVHLSNMLDVFIGKTVKARQLALNELVKAIREFRKFTDQPLTLRGSEYAHVVQELNKAIDRADRLLR